MPRNLDESMNEVGKIQFTVLRIFYLVAGVSFGFLAGANIWGGESGFGDFQSIVKSIFYALALLSLVGVARPLMMLPLLLFSLAWKSIWIMAFVFPMYFGDGLDSYTKNILLPIFSGLVVTIAAIPWRYTVGHYFKFNTAL